jgi:3-oxoadipate enol-lactonase
VPDPADYASDAIALLNHLGIEAAVFVGQSMGGWTGIEMALADPNRLAALVLSGTTGSLSYDVYDDPDVKAWHERAPALVEELTHAGVHRATGRTFAAEQPALHALYCSIDRLNSALDKDEISRRIRATRTRGAEDAARITCPVLCVFGEDDVVISPAGVRAVAQRLPAARVVGIPATGHSTYFERASLFNSVLAGFLREIDWRS